MIKARISWQRLAALRHSFAYDPLDNLRVLDQGSRQFRYHYDASNRLEQIKSPTGALLHSFGYDARGNTTSKDSGTLTFDLENRLTASALPAVSTYIYDGLGRRVSERTGNKSTYFYYSHAGSLLRTADYKTSTNTDHIYLSGSLVASRKVPHGGGVAEVTYQHTDALGTPVAFTDASGNVIRRERMTAWGEPADGTWSNGPGYTGHQMDAGSKLVYMQQRHYDPAVGRFLSVDPIASDMQNGWNFNRHNYASSNPYKFVDPDGRLVRRHGDGLPAPGSPECRSNPACNFALDDNGGGSRRINPVVKDAMRESMRASNPDADPADRREQGFYYGLEEGGEMGVRHWPEGGMNSITPPGVGSDGKYQGLQVEGEAHTHPHRRTDINPVSGKRFSTRVHLLDRAGVRMSNYPGLSYVVSHDGVEVLDSNGKTIDKISASEVFGESSNWWSEE